MKINKLDDRQIEYRIIRTNRKTVGLIVDPDQGVIIRSPKYLSDKQIEKIVKKKSKWLFKKLAEVKKIKARPEPKEFINGEKLLYLGKEYSLLVNLNDKINGVGVEFKNNQFYLQIPSLLTGEERISECRKTMIKWYKESARSVFGERVEFYQKRLGVLANKVKAKEQRKRWGSCSSKGNLNINWRLIMAPLAILDYIVVHELSHLIHPDHSGAFWQTVKIIIPDYQEKEVWLKINGRLLDI